MMMNREQQRRAMKNGEYMHRSEVDALLRSTGRKMLKKAVNDYSAALALCLRDKLGFGHERSKRFLGQVSELFADIQDDRLSIADIKKTLKEEMGIIID